MRAPSSGWQRIAHGLLLVERARLAQELRGDSDLADVVQCGAVLEAAKRGGPQSQPATDGDGEVDDRERVSRRRGILDLERADERLDRREEAGLGELRRAVRAQRERDMRRDVLEHRDLVGPERRPRDARHDEASAQHAVDHDRNCREAGLGGVRDAVELQGGRRAFEQDDLGCA